MRGQSLHRKLLEQTVKVIQNQHAISALNGCRNLIGEIYLHKKVHFYVPGYAHAA